MNQKQKWKPIVKPSCWKVSIRANRKSIGKDLGFGQRNDPKHLALGMEKKKKEWKNPSRDFS